MTMTLSGTSGITMPVGTTSNASCVAWVNFSASGGTITMRSNYNVTSVTRTATGFYTIVMTNALIDANYCVVGNACENWGVANIIAPQLYTSSSDTESAPSTTTFAIKVANTGGTGTDVKYVNLAVFR